MLEIKTNDAESAAKIIVVGVGGAGNNAVNIVDFNLISDMVGNSAQIKLSDNSLTTLTQTIEKGLFEYVFEGSTTGTINVNRSLIYSLYDAVKDTSDPNITYNLLAQDDVEQDLGDMLPTNLTIVGDGQYSINGNGHKGIIVSLLWRRPGDGSGRMIRSLFPCCARSASRASLLLCMMSLTARSGRVSRYAICASISRAMA